MSYLPQADLQSKPSNPRHKTQETLEERRMQEVEFGKRKVETPETRTIAETMKCRKQSESEMKLRNVPEPREMREQKKRKWRDCRKYRGNKTRKNVRFSGGKPEPHSS